MAVSIFDDKLVMPNNEMVAGVIADAYSLWDELVNHIKEEYPNVTEEWKFYGKAAGWTLKLISKKRNLIILIPKSKCFRVRVGLGERAALCVENADLPDEIKEAVSVATPYVEGRSIDMDISFSGAKVMAYIKDRSLVDIGTISEKQLETIKTLLKIKFEN